MYFEAVSPDGKTTVKISTDKDTLTTKTCTEHSPEVCNTIPDPQGVLAFIVSERLWHRGWTVVKNG